MIDLKPATAITTETTLAAIALRGDAHASVLDRHRLDFCCGGKRTLAAACAAAGLQAGRILEEIDAEVGARASAATDWSEQPVPALVRHILDTHHRFTREALARIGELQARVTAKHAGSHPELTAIARAAQALNDELVPHMAREEHVLFPYILSLCGDRAGSAPPFGSLVHPLRVMTADHEAAGALLDDLRRLTGGFVPPPDACASYRALYGAFAELRRDLMIHVALENEVLFPQALALEQKQAARRAQNAQPLRG